MSKIEIAGPRDLLEETLSLLKETGIFQIDYERPAITEKTDEDYIRSIKPDARILSERVLLEDIKNKIGELFSYIPDTGARECYIDPGSVIDMIGDLVKKHLSVCKELTQKRSTLEKEINELSQYAHLLDVMESLIGDVKELPDIELIGLTVKNPEAVRTLKDHLSLITDQRFEFATTTLPDGTVAGLIVIEKKLSEKIRTTLREGNIPEFHFPPSLRDLTYTEKVSFLKSRISELRSGIEMTDRELNQFSRRWGPIYREVRKWINERLSILGVTASVLETRLCFFIYGWIPALDMEDLRTFIATSLGDKLSIRELEIKEEELERVPVLLRNSSYFQPFEHFTRLLPLPAYTSYDPTPFIGIFFPIFFGIILGDAGYGLTLLLLSFLILRVQRRRIIRDAAMILLSAALYSIFFGLIFGEFFGDIGHRLFGLKTICFERRTSVFPVLYFAVTVGVIHIFLGLFLGFLNELKRKSKRKAFYKLINILFILMIIILIISLFKPFPVIITRPAIIALLILTPLLFFTGGLLAPFELLKSIGNIISYVRIMAIGMTSVLLAFVANRLAGMTGDIMIGILVAVLLHTLNIVIGIFSPTIHSLRLHYVEFFSKFIEHGGRGFEPLKKTRR
jgi:V/A-type H+-transporting ATPase subunit I